MNSSQEKRILDILSFLEKGSYFTKQQMLTWLKMTPYSWCMEEDGYGYQYYLISYPLTSFTQPYLIPEKIVLLVFEGETVIADIAAVWAKTDSLLNDDSVNDALMDMDTWTQSCLYVMKTAFQNHDAFKQDNALGCIICNAYVTESYRRRGIFTTMMQMVRDHCIRFSFDTAILFQTISLDPDVACYGPDKSDETYYYSMEKDEPKRMLNGEIIQHLDFAVVQLEHGEEDTLSDGTFIWYGIKAEHITIVEGDADSLNLS